jgi:hypothetical protein
MEVIEVTEREVEVIEVIERGPAGPAGATGPQGPAGAGGVTSVTGTAPIVSSGGTTPAISVTVGTGANTVAAGNDTRIANIAANSINTVDSGGSIDTSSGGGSINTRGTGSIQLGVSGTRTTFTGTATEDRAISLPNASGTLVTQEQIGISGDQAGSINLEGANVAFGGFGGSIIAQGTYSSTGGTLDMSGSQFGNGGSITTKDGGGSIDTRGNGTVAGGSIDTSLGGGSVSTRGTGSIELGVSATRTTLTGTATAARAISLPNASGTLALSGAAGAFTTLTATPAAGSTALTLTGGTVTASAPLLSGTQTWNDAAVTFTGLLVNVTNTASASASLLASFQVGGTSVANIRRDGRVLATSLALVSGGNSGTGFSYHSASEESGHLQCVNNAGTQMWTCLASRFRLAGDLSFGRSVGLGQSPDTILVRDDVATLAQRNAANAQTFRLYNTFTDASNYERLFIRGQTGANFQIGTEALGTGSGRNLELVRAGTTQFRVDANGVTVRAAIGGSFAGYQFGSSGVTGVDCTLFRDEVAVLGTENSFRFYNTAAGGRPWTSTTITSFERATISWASNVFRIAAEKGTTGGSARAIEFATDSTTRLTIGASGGFTLADAQDIAVGTTTGTKIGTGTTQLLGFWNATPAAQPAAVADATDAATVITQLNALLSRLRTIGIIAT